MGENGNKDKLQVLYDTLKGCIIKYQKSVKAANIKYFTVLFNWDKYCKFALSTSTMTHALGDCCSSFICLLYLYYLLYEKRKRKKKVTHGSFMVKNDRHST